TEQNLHRAPTEGLVWRGDETDGGHPRPHATPGWAARHGPRHGRTQSTRRARHGRPRRSDRLMQGLITQVGQSSNNLGLFAPTYQFAQQFTVDQMRTLNSVPITLVPSGGKFTILIPISMYSVFNAGVTPVVFSGSGVRLTIANPTVTLIGGGGAFGDITSFIG